MNDQTITVKNGVVFLPEAKKIKRKIASVLRNKKLSKEKKLENIWLQIFVRIKSYGELTLQQGLNEGKKQKAVYQLKSGLVYELSKKNEVLEAVLYHNFGINSAHPIYKVIFRNLVNTCFLGDTIRAAPFSLYDTNEQILYFPKSDHEMIVCTQNGVESVPNGSGQVHINVTSQFTPFDYLDRTSDSENASIHKHLFSNLNCFEGLPDSLNAQETGFILEIFFYFIVFANQMENRPILIIHGMRRSGKSTILSLMGKVLFGPGWNISLVPRNRRDLEVEFTNNCLSCFDNIDRQLKKPLRDAFASLATGGGFKERTLYTNDGQQSYNPRPVIAIATRNPSLTDDDDDIIDRAIIVRLKPFPEDTSRSTESKRLSEVLKHRNEILTEMVNTMPDILKALNEDAPVEPNTSFRIVDFTNFAFKSAFPIFEGRIKHSEIGRRLNIVFDKLLAAQKAFVLNQPLHFALDAYLADYMNHNPNNLPQKVLTSDLYKELLKTDEEHYFGFKKTCNSSISLGIRMTQNKETFTDRYGYSAKRGTGNKKAHSFAGPIKNPLEI
jgi:hypothetical protein